ncbi:MAG: deoxyribose-phosphate aldolase, partial [Bacteroidota bacterium]
MELSKYIDHTILSPGCTSEDIKRICDEAKHFGFYAICIPPYYVRLAARELEDSPVKIATVVGFPMGYAAIPAKVEEIKRAIDEGADELDIVANIAAVKNGDWAHVRNDIDGVTIAVHLKGKKVKLIVEATLLTEAEIIKICTICREVGVDFVKTSTG